MYPFLCKDKGVKFTLEQAMKAQRERRDIVLISCNLDAERRVGGQRHVPAALYPVKTAGTHCTGSWVGPRAGVDL